MFAKDRDLYVLEPGLHKDVAWVGQRRISTIGSLVGTALTITNGSFVDAQVSAGHVVIFDGMALEVVSVEGATQAAVSLMRGDVSGGAVPGVNASNRVAIVYDYSPQRAMVHRQVMTMLGFDVDADGFDESVVTNPDALVRLEALGTLHLIYAGAGARGGLERSLICGRRCIRSGSLLSVSGWWRWLIWMGMGLPRRRGGRIFLFWIVGKGGG